MKNIYPLILVAMLLITNRVFSQAEIQIKFIGNCGLHITDGTSNLYLDFPYKSGAHNYMEYDKSELHNIKDGAVLIYTHSHSDHYSKRLSKTVSKKIYGPWNVDQLQELNSSIPDFKIQAFKTKHLYTLTHYSYLITWHNKKIYISGDTEHAETIATMKDLDWAFIPVWLLMDAKEKGIKLKTLSKMLAIYHIGPKDKITNDKNDPQIKLLDKQGEIIVIPK